MLSAFSDLWHAIGEHLPDLQKLGHLSFLGGLLTLLANGWLKRIRLKSAIRLEISNTSVHLRQMFTPIDLVDVIARMERDDTYRPVFVLSSRHVVIGNLTDDIAYLSKKQAERVLSFNDHAELLDDMMRFIRSSDYLTVDMRRRKAILEKAWSLAAELQVRSADLLRIL